MRDIYRYFLTYLIGAIVAWSYGSWIYNYLCNQWLSPLMLSFRISIRARCTPLCDKVVSDLRQVGGFLRFFRFPPSKNWPPWYNWNIVKSGIKHHQTNKLIYLIVYILTWYCRYVFFNTLLKWCKYLWQFLFVFGIKIF